MSGPAFTFAKAVKQQEKLRLALDGPAGSGKTWTALIIGTDLAEREGGRVAVIDSERSSARKYASDFDFDHLTLPDWSPHTYMAAVRSAVDAGYAVIIIDSFSHAWEGVLELKDNATARSRSKNSYTEGWREATPVHNELVDTVLRAEAHVIATLRTKTEYVIGDDKSITKVGLKPIQRDGVDFEFDVVGDMTAENSMVISKTRCSRLAGEVIRRPDNRLAEILWNWLTDGEPAIPASDADRIAAVLNEVGKDGRKAWLDRFGMKPGQIGASRLDEANAFIATLATPPQDDPDPEPPPAGPDGDGLGAGVTADSDAAAGDHTGATAPAPTNGGGGGAGGPSPAAAPYALNVKDVAAKATRVFKDLGDEAAAKAAKGEKTAARNLVVDRLRHTLAYACSNGQASSFNDLAPDALTRVWDRLDDIEHGRLTFVQDDKQVTFTLQSGRSITVRWADVERSDNGEQAA